MKIGLDLDDTITAMPEFFSVLSKALTKAGHKIYVITYRNKTDRMDTVQELREFGIEYEKLFCSDWNNEDMGPYKARIAREVGLDLMIDDSPEVLAELPDTVKRIWVCDPQVFSLKACLKGMKEAIFEKKVIGGWPG